MKSIDTASFAMSVLMLYIIGISSCGGESVAPDVTGDVSAEHVTDSVPLDVVDMRVVPCPDGELTLEYAMRVMNDKLCDNPFGECGNIWDRNSPQCRCRCCGGPSLTENIWFCYDSQPVSDAY